MATTSVTLSGFVYDNAGNAVQDATVAAYTSADNATSAISGLTDTTDANGRWDITTADEAQYPMDIKITFGSAVRWIKAGNGINLTRLTVSGDAVFGEDATGVDVTMYGDTTGRYLLWDQSEDALHLNDNTELKVGSLAAGDMVLYHDGTNSYIKNATGALKIATESSGIAVTIGHGTSEVTVADNLTVTGNLTVSGTQTIVDTVTMNAANAIVFEGATADGYETTLTIEDPTADRTVVIPNVGGTLAVLAADSDTAITATPAELNLIDGGTARGTTAIADGDGVLINDGGTMRMTTVETLATYMEGEINALSLGVTFSGASTFSNTVTVGVDDTGYDVKFFGATASAFMLWDESEDDLVLSGTAQLSIDTATDATNTTSGSFHTDGGVGIAKKLYVGTDLDVAGTSNIEDTVVLGTLTVGVDDTSHDVKFFGAAAGAYMEWDQSADQLRIMGASADATTSTGKLLLATSLTDVNANDVIGKIDFQAPHEAGGTDAIEIAASIQAIAQGTFAADLNATDLIFYTGHSEAATEKFRFTSQGEIGIGGANYGTDGQVLTSTGAGTAPAWEDVTVGDITSIVAGTGLSGSSLTSGDATLNVDASLGHVTTVGALDAGSITSNFGTINNGSDNITTSGTIAGGPITGTTIAPSTSIINVGGGANNDWTLNALTLAGSSSEQVLTVGSTSVTGGAKILLSVTASSAQDAQVIFQEGSGNGDANNQGYLLGYKADESRFRIASQNVDGSSTFGAVLTIADGTNDVTFAGSINIPAADKLYLDGGGDTYIYQESADDLHIVVGNSIYMQIDQDINSIVLGGGGGAPSVTQGIIFDNDFIGNGSGWEFGHNFGGTLTGGSGNTNRLAGTIFQTPITTQVATEDIAIVAEVEIREPLITDRLTGDITVATSLLIRDAPTEGVTNAALYVASGDIIGLGSTYIGDTANANMTVGLTINQGANDNQILALKSSDVDHGTSKILVTKETEDFAVFQKSSATGGLIIEAVEDGGSTTEWMRFGVLGRAVDTSKNTSAAATFTIFTSQHNSAGGNVDVGSDGNVFAVRARVSDSNLVRVLVDEAGDLYSVTSAQTFDDYDDMALIETYDAARSGSLKEQIKADFGRTMLMDEATLIEAGVLGDTMANGGLTNQTQLSRVLTGGVRQLNQKHMSLAEKVDGLEVELIEAKKQLAAISA